MDAIVPEPQKNGGSAGAHRADQRSPPLPALAAFRSALEAGRIGLWSWDLRSNRMTWSTTLEDFHGRSEDSQVGALSIAPDDFPAEDAGVLAAIHRALRSHEPCRLEYRLPGPSGRAARWFEATVTVTVE